VDIWLSLLVVTVGATDSPETMPFIKALCPLVAFKRPEVKGLGAFDFRSFYECGTKSLIGPIGVDIQLFNPIPIQNQHTTNRFVDFSHPHLGTRHDGSHKVPLHLLVRMHKRRNRRYRRMPRAQENFCGSPMIRLFGPPNHGHAIDSHSEGLQHAPDTRSLWYRKGGLELPLLLQEYRISMNSGSQTQDTFDRIRSGRGRLRRTLSALPSTGLSD